MENLFCVSLKNHQEIIDVLLLHQREDGYCYILKKDINNCINRMTENRNRTYTWLKQAIARINYSNIVIEEIETGVFKVHYSNLLENSVFRIISNIITDIVTNPQLIGETDFKLMTRYEVDRKIISMVRAYLMSGWKRAYSVIQ